LNLVSSVEDQQEDSESDEERSGFSKSDESQVSFGTVAFFSWIKTATINGNTVNVLNSALEQLSSGEVSDGDHGSRVVFSFDSTVQGPIAWDPKLSWSAPLSNTLSGAESIVPGIALLVALIAALL
jgi:hypothetical protein